MARPATPRQLWPGDKFQFNPFSYAKAIIKDDVTYPIVPNCPIINVDNLDAFNVSNIPVGAFFIIHSQDWDARTETLCLRVPDNTNNTTGASLNNGYIAMVHFCKNSFN